MEPLGGGEVVTVRPAGAAATGPGALVYLHGGAFVNGIQPQHWTLVAHLADTTQREVHVARYPLAPAHDVTDAEAFLEALHERLAPAAPLHVLGDSAGGTLALRWAQTHAEDGTIAGLTLIAPWLDLSMSNPAADLVEPHDPWLTRAGMRPIAAHWVAGRELTDPRREPAVRRPHAPPADPRARRVARHLPPRLRPAARPGPALGRPHPARRGRLTPRLPAAADARGSAGPGDHQRARAAHAQRVRTSRSVNRPPATGTKVAVSRSAVTCTSSDPYDGSRSLPLRAAK